MSQPNSIQLVDARNTAAGAPTVSNQTAPVLANFQTAEGFNLMQRQAKALAYSTLVPQQFRGDDGVPNCIIALEMATRTGASPFMVMQHLYVVHGKPNWSSQFVIAAINSCGRYSPLRFEMTGEGDAKTCVAWATELATGNRLESPPVSIQMAKDEGWFGKNGSKWKTMPDLMLRYRAATFFGRLYAPEILMGMRTTDEIVDMGADPEGVFTIEPEATTMNAEREAAKPNGNGKKKPAKTNAPAEEPAPVPQADVTTQTESTEGMIKCPGLGGKLVSEDECEGCPEESTCDVAKSRIV